MENIEEYATSPILPVNSIVTLRRLETVLIELKTNALMTETAQRDKRIRRLMYLLNVQYYGSLAEIDLMKEYKKL